jgi:hypothetical protein
MAGDHSQATDHTARAVCQRRAAQAAAGGGAKHGAVGGITGSRRCHPISTRHLALHSRGRHLPHTTIPASASDTCCMYAVAVARAWTNLGPSRSHRSPHCTHRPAVAQPVEAHSTKRTLDATASCCACVTGRLTHRPPLYASQSSLCHSLSLSLPPLRLHQRFVSPFISSFPFVSVLLLSTRLQSTLP